MAEQQYATYQNMENYSNYSDDDDQEAYETISFSDYSFASSNAAVQGADHSGQILQKGSRSSSSATGSDQEHYFEFCSGEWTNSILSDEWFPAENIIFCGKIITSDAPTSHLEETGNAGKPVAAEYYSFRWDGSHNTNRRKPEIFGIKKEEQKLRTKVRWSLFLLGGTRTRFQTETALRDIKIRQSRLNLSSTLFRLDNNGGDGLRENRRHQGLWGLLKAVSHGGQRHANSVANASVRCIPRLLHNCIHD